MSKVSRPEKSKKKIEDDAAHPALVLLFLTVFFLAIAVFFAPQFQVFGNFIVENFGLEGLFLSVFLGDLIVQPFPPDIIVYSYTFSDYSPWVTIFLGATASVLAGIGGFGLGKWLQEEGALRFIGKRHYDKAHKLFMKYGFWAVFVGAMTPAPFAAVCWAAGIFGMPFRYFVLSAISTRIPRYLIVGGLAVLMSS